MRVVCENVCGSCVSLITNKEEASRPESGPCHLSGKLENLRGFRTQDTRHGPRLCRTLGNFSLINYTIIITKNSA